MPTVRCYYCVECMAAYPLKEGDHKCRECGTPLKDIGWFETKE